VVALVGLMLVESSDLLARDSKFAELNWLFNNERSVY